MILKTLCKCVLNGLNDSLLMRGLWIALLKCIILKWHIKCKNIQNYIFTLQCLLPEAQNQMH